MRYQFIKDHQGLFAIETMCRVLEVSSSGYYQWRQYPLSERKKENIQLVEQITQVHQLSRQTYGSPRIHAELKAQGIKCAENPVARLMKNHGIRAKTKKKYVVTTDSAHAFPIAENRLNQQFEAQAPNEKWVADIPYIWTQQGWLYLAVVLDLFSGRVVGWSMQASLGKGLVIPALTRAIKARQPPVGLLHPSDRGSQYASKEYRGVLQKMGIQCSMSRKGNCYDNSARESFFATLKPERVDDQVYPSRQDARLDSFHYIETWYNRKRRHSTLNYFSPEQYENNYHKLLLVA